MTYNILGLGETGSKWDGVGLSIGVNDCFKYKPTQSLLICNHPGRFTAERLQIIRNSKPHKFYSNSDTWKSFFPDYIKIKLRSWDGHLRKDLVQHTDTSPFIAMSLAYQLGATKIVLWGVDFNFHSTINQKNGSLNNELRQYKQLTEALRGEGIEVYLGSKGSMLDEFLTVYTGE